MSLKALEPDEIIKTDSLPAVEYDSLLGEVHGSLVDLSVKVDQTKDRFLERIALHNERLEAAFQRMSAALDEKEAEFDRKLVESLGRPTDAAYRTADDNSCNHERKWTDRKR